jgi:hypothetical protein
MKKLNFFVSEYREERKKLNEKMRPWMTKAIIANILTIFLFLNFFIPIGSTFADVMSRLLQDEYTVFLVMSPLLAFGISFGGQLYKIHGSFWKTFAERNGGSYEGQGRVSKENALMFKQGTAQSITNMVTFREDNEVMKIFQFSFSKKNKILQQNLREYYYTVFLFTLERNPPHMYLNYKANTYGMNIGTSIPLPTEFEKSFTISIPQGYHIEVLQIFTPEILAAILDFGIHLDIEVCNNKIYFYIEKGQYSGKISSVKHIEELEKKYNAVVALMGMLKPRLDAFRFEKIGDLPHTL